MLRSLIFIRKATGFSERILKNEQIRILAGKLTVEALRLEAGKPGKSLGNQVRAYGRNAGKEPGLSLVAPAYTHSVLKSENLKV